ncbi:MAG: hypothetical protein ACP5D2_03345, partial [Candidatus Nanoarchaeia archaeon]
VTHYDFTRFWDPSSDEETFENDGGSAPRIRYPANLRGLYVVCSHWMCRGNSFGELSVKELVQYLRDNNERIDAEKIPDMRVEEWLKRLYEEDKQLRQDIGLNKIDILANTVISLRMKDKLGVPKNTLEDLADNLK